VLLVLFAAASNLMRSRSGRAMMAIRDHPIAAARMGINTALYKTLTFGVSAMFTGIAGALGAIVVQFVAPDSFSFLLSCRFWSADYRRHRVDPGMLGGWPVLCSTCPTSPSASRPGWRGRSMGSSCSW